MYPSRWISMGGDYSPGQCTKDSNYTMSEWALGKKLGDQAAINQVLHQHWDTWFTQSDVDQIAKNKITTVRIPVGFWLVEGIVDRSTEFYAEGGMDMLISRLEMLKRAGIAVILDHHALPGVSAVNQMFAGNCTDEIHFYTDANYRRAITWTAVMTFLIHAHPAFSTVASLQAVNEPIQDASQTPGLQDFYAIFILTVRAIEASFGIICDTGMFNSPYSSYPIFLEGLKDAIPLLIEYASTYDLESSLLSKLVFAPLHSTVGVLSNLLSNSRSPSCIATSFMDSSWQWAANDTAVVANAANFALGPSLYDNHFYLAFGWVAPEATEESYLSTICNTSRLIDATHAGDVPLYFGEWSLGTQWANASSTFLKKFSDAQKLTYGKGSGWMFWSWRVDSDGDCIGGCLEWSYKDAVKAGVLTTDPSILFNNSVCDPYV
ncbi:glycoside hydrolase family 5 protein [Meredithblackwellia eburnea MCA 4105]